MGERRSRRSRDSLNEVFLFFNLFYPLSFSDLTHLRSPPRPAAGASRRRGEALLLLLLLLPPQSSTRARKGRR